MTERSSAGSCSSRDAACAGKADGRKWERSTSVMARPSAACSSVNFAAAS